MGEEELGVGVPSLDLDAPEDSSTISASLFALFPSSVETGMPVVGGHELTIPEWTAFGIWAGTGYHEKTICRDMRKRGFETVTVNMVKVWKGSLWWNELGQAFLKNGQRLLSEGLSRRVPAMLEAVDGVLRGEVQYQKLGGPIVQLFRVFAEMGVEPLISRGGALNVTDNSQVSLNLISSEKFKDMAPEDLMALARPKVLIPVRRGPRRHK